MGHFPSSPGGKKAFYLSIALAKVLMDLFGKLDFGWKMRGRHALGWYTARLMSAVEDTEEPLGYDCFSISRGIKGICKERVSGKINVWVPCEKHKNENSHRGVPSIFCFTLSPQRVWSTFIPRWYDVTVALPGRWKSCAFVGSQSELLCSEPLFWG